MSGLQIDNKQLVIPPMGFENTGSICYFNSLLQCLLSSSVFLAYMIKHPTKEFTEFFRFIINGQWDLIFSTRLLQTYNLVRPNQSVSEYFGFFLERLHLEPIFECSHRVISRCQGCGYTKETKDKFYNLLVDGHFSEFFKYEEILDDVKCDQCKQKHQVFRKRLIEGIPPVLAISLNKYLVKRDIDYPQGFKIEDVSYRLIGTVEHYGVLGAGHYVARFHRNGQYMMANDSRVTPITDITPTCNTYMIFYERV